MTNNKKHTSTVDKNGGKLKQVGLSNLVQENIIKEERTVKSVLSRVIVNEQIKTEEELHKKRAEIIDKYYKRYNEECLSFINRGIIIEPKVMNKCCVILYNTRSINKNNTDKQTLIILKTVIRSVVSDVLQLVYIYSNLQLALRNLASELHDNSIEYDYLSFVDIAYSELFDELRSKNKRGK